MRIVMFPSPSGSAYWRLIDPAKYLRKNGFEVKIAEEGINEDIAKWADVYVLQNCINKEGIALLHAYQKEYGKKLVSDWDDFFISNETSPYKKLHELKQFPEIAEITIKISDAITVTTEHLARKYAKYNKNVFVLKNAMDFTRWKRPLKKNNSKFIRIGWAGSITHLEDLKLIEKPLKKILKEFKNTQLVLLGDMRLSDMFKGYNCETMLGVPFEYWADRLSGLQLDIGLAPLVDTEFNRCKSNIKWQEYSINKIPGVYSPTVYNASSHHVTFDGKLGLIANTQDQWYRCIKNYIVCPNLRDDIANYAHSFVAQEYNLRYEIRYWIDMYRKLTQ